MFKYKIQRPCLWFAKNDVVEVEKFKKYYTPHAIKSLIEYGYIKIINVKN
jgi:hypothetical protein